VYRKESYISHNTELITLREVYNAVLAVEKRLNHEKGLLDKSLNQTSNASTSPPRPQGSQGYQGSQGSGGGGYVRGGSHQGGRGQGKAGSGGNSGSQARGAEQDASKTTEGKKKAPLV